jgi:hypothetical protein
MGDLQANMKGVGPGWEGLEEAVPLRARENPAQQRQGLVYSLGTPLRILAQILLQEFGKGQRLKRFGSAFGSLANASRKARPWALVIAVIARSP